MKNKNRLFFPCAVAAAWTVVLRLDPPKYCKQNVWDQDYNTEGCLIHSSCWCTRSCSMEVKQFRWLIAPGGSWYRSVLAGNNVLAPEESLLEKGESVSWLECLFGWLILVFFFFFLSLSVRTILYVSQLNCQKLSYPWRDCQIYSVFFYNARRFPSDLCIDIISWKPCKDLFMFYHRKHWIEMKKLFLKARYWFCSYR